MKQQQSYEAKYTFPRNIDATVSEINGKKFKFLYCLNLTPCAPCAMYALNDAAALLLCHAAKHTVPRKCIARIKYKEKIKLCYCLDFTLWGMYALTAVVSACCAFKQPQNYLEKNSACFEKVASFLCSSLVASMLPF